MVVDKPKVLITGASGLIGGLTWRNLGDKYEFSGLNRRDVPEIPNTQADISDFDAILPAFKGIDMVVHMANHTTDAESWDKHLQMGIIGTRNVYEASRLNGVKRVVLGSTGDTMTGYEMEYPYGELAAGEYGKVAEPWTMLMHTDPTRPKSVYGACKVFCEALGHWYSDRYDMSVLCIRLGGVLKENRPNLRRQYPGWLISDKQGYAEATGHRHEGVRHAPVAQCRHSDDGDHDDQKPSHDSSSSNP